MPGGEHSEATREAVAARLAAGTPVVEAAAASNVSESTVRRWLREDAEFRRMVGELRGRAIEAAMGVLSDSAVKAARTLHDLLDGDGPQAKLGAARAVLEYAFRGRELLDLAERLDAIEEAVARKKG